MTQTIDFSTAKYVADLGRLGISEEEAQKFSGQLSSIIDYFNILNEVDTENVPPAYLDSGRNGAMREDEVDQPVTTDEFLANAPESKDGYVVIPRVHIER